MSCVNIVHENEGLPDVVLHHLPCKIKVDENYANTKSFFSPKVATVSNRETLQATFRGRLLDGKVIKLPDNYCGYTLEENERPLSEEEKRELKVSGKFQEFTQWYIDSQCIGSNLTEHACTTWAGKLADAIHKPIEPDD